MHMAHIVREMRGVAPTADGKKNLLETCFFRIDCPRAISYTTSEVAISAAEESGSFIGRVDGKKVKKICPPER
jgi:hypothetical protein